MKRHTKLQGGSVLFSIALAISPVIHAAGEGSLQMAKAIGQDTAPPPATAPKQKEAPSKKPATETATTTTQEVTESQPLSPGARIGLIIAGLLALAGGGGGGGGGGGAPTTSQ